MLVLDDFLPAGTFREILDFCKACDYTSVHAQGWNKVWRAYDGLPLRSDTFMFKAATALRGSGRASRASGRAGDRFFEAMLNCRDQFAHLIGKPQRDWSSVTAASWVYPAGSELSIHRDSAMNYHGYDYVGAYSFYVHPEWKLQWGGWLLVLEDDGGIPRKGSAPRKTAPAARWLGYDDEQEAAQYTGIGTCIAPLPNRMVLLSPDAPHMITRVDANAGQHSRISLAGFFLKKVSRRR